MQTHPLPAQVAYLERYWQNKNSDILMKKRLLGKILYGGENDVPSVATQGVGWRCLVAAFRNGEVNYDFPLNSIQTAFAELGINVDI